MTNKDDTKTKKLTNLANNFRPVCKKTYQKKKEEIKKLKEQTSKEFLELNQENRKLKQSNRELEKENGYWRELIKEEKALERIYQLTCQLAQKDKENELLKEEKQQKEHELKTRLLRSDKRFFEAVERINDTRREKKQLQHDLENLRTQLNQVKTENIIKNIQSERDREAMRIQSWEKRALETRGNLESVWQALGRSQNYAEELKRRNEALEEHIKAFNQRQVEAKIQEIPKDWKEGNWN